MANRKPALKIEYRRARNKGTWHWSPNCPGWPTSDYFSWYRTPDEDSGVLCDECEASIFSEGDDDEIVLNRH